MSELKNRKWRRANRDELYQEAAKLTNTRSCGPCTACCTMLNIDELMKPEGQDCKSLRSSGCSRYADRPRTCKEFFCLWRFGNILDEDQRPDRTGVLLYVGQDESFLFLMAMCRDENTAERAKTGLKQLAELTKLPVVVRTPRAARYIVLGSDPQITEARAVEERMQKRRRLPILERNGR